MQILLVRRRIGYTTIHMVLLELDIHIHNHNYTFRLVAVENIPVSIPVNILVLVHNSKHNLQTMYILRILVLSAHNFHLNKSTGMVKLELQLG
jgi:hypothetical protein